MGKNLPAVQETWAWSLGWKGLLEKEMATHSSILTWKIPGIEESAGLHSVGSPGFGHNWITNTHVLFSVVVYKYESWTIMKAEHQRIDAFELWCWRKLLRVLWTPRWSNQSVLEEINWIHWKDCCWSCNTLIIWCEEQTHWKIPWCLERLKAKRERGDRGQDG